MTKRFKTNIFQCDRCGEDHPHVRARLFNRPPPEYDAFAMCPVTAEPVLLDYVQDQLEDDDE